MSTRDARSDGDAADLTARFQRYRETNDRRLRNDLVSETLSIAQACARRFANRGEPLADLEQREKWPTRDLHVLSDHHGNRSPRANPHARGAVVGLTLEQGRDALARLYLATLQALAYGTRHIIESMNAAGHRIERIVMCGGGTKNPYWLRENADATGCEIHLVGEEDAVTLGAALLGSVACGAFATLPDAAASYTKAQNGTAFTNTLVTTSVTVTKQWKLKDNRLYKLKKRGYNQISK